MKNLLHKAIILAMLATTWVSCSEDTWTPVDTDTAIECGSTINVSMNLSIPDPVKVSSRNVSVVEKIEDITVLCFDKDGRALVSAEATLKVSGDESGNMTATIPNTTRIMHVLANQTVQVVKGQTEAEVLNGLKATSNKMVYWARLEVPADVTSSADVKVWWEEVETITLLRNMAKVEVSVESDDFICTGFTVVNTNESGYAVPYYADEEIYPTDGTSFALNDWLDADYIHAAGIDLVSGTETEMGMGAIYVYETPSTTPASIIIRGRNKVDDESVVKYWRVAFKDDSGKQMNIRRNHRYTVKIDGHLLYGDEDVRNEAGEIVESGFDKAMNNESEANSAWLTIADEVTAVRNSKFSLTLDNTSYVMINGTSSLSFNFYIDQMDETELDETLTVAWEGVQNVSANNTVSYSPSIKSNGGKQKLTGTVNLSLLKLGELTKREGTILIKYGSNLQRRVKITIIPKQTFEPVTHVDKEPGADVTAPIAELKFTIPDTYPASMYPFTVLISTKDFTVRKVKDAQKDISLVWDGDGGYGKYDNGIGYKFAYQVAAPGEHSVFLISNVGIVQDYGYVTLEAEKFELFENYAINLNRTTNKNSGKEE